MAIPIDIAARPELDRAVQIEWRGDHALVLSREGELLRMGELEVRLLQLADGRTPVEAIAARVGAELGGELDTHIARGFFAQAGRLGLLALPGRGARTSGLESSALFVAWPLLDPSALLRRLVRHTAWLATAPGLVAWLVLVIGGLSQVVDLALPPATALLRPAAAVAFYVAWATAVVVHELAHAVTSVRLGAPVRHVGIGLFAGVIPFAYADVTPSCMLARRSARVAVLVAGTLGSLTVMAVAGVIVGILAPGDAVRDGLLLFVATAGVGVLFNWSPLIRLDGYYVLVELVDVPNLRTRAFAWARAAFGRALLGPVCPVPTLAGRERWIVPLFAVAGIGFAIWLVDYAIEIAWETMVAPWRGYGLAAFAVAALVLTGPALVRGVRSAASFVMRRRDALLRPRGALRVLASFALAAIFAFGVRCAEDVDARFEIEPSTRASVRAVVGGRVAEVWVHGGQLVARGEPIGRLDDPELRRRRIAAEAALVHARVELDRIHAGATAQERALAAATTRAAAARSQAARRLATREQLLSDAAVVAASDAERSAAAAADATAGLREAAAERALVDARPRIEDVAVAAARLRVAELELAAVERDLADLVLQSAADGIVVDVHPEDRIGTLLEPGDVLCTIESTVHVAIASPDWIPDADALVGSEVDVVLPTGTVLTTVVARVLPRGDSDTIRVESAALQAPELRSGIHGRASMHGPAVPLAVEYVWHPLVRIGLEIRAAL